MHEALCPVCHGSRLKLALLNTTFLGKNIHELTSRSVAACLDLFSKADEVGGTISAISQVVLPAVKEAMSTMVDLGLGHLTLGRAVSTLSGGEQQRVSLTGQFSTHLFGVIYVFDEPTIGLDRAQSEVLVAALRKIVSNGNTVVVVEHDPTFIRNADHLIEMGPGAGSLGGEVVYQGKIGELEKVKHSVTYRLLQGEHTVPAKSAKKGGQSFGLKGAAANNLKHIDVDFKAEQLIAISGVSGSGKSSLIKDVLFRSWLRGRPVYCQSVYGMDPFEEVILVDQELMRQSNLGTPASYTGVLEGIKTVFSKTETAKALGFKKADFSYQSKNGKCKACAGHGQLKTSMDFMSDLWLTCENCNGMRYNEAILECKFKSQSIGEVLAMTVQEAIEFFESGAIVDSLKVLQQVGLGHLWLGQPGTTLSGGEAQRLKLASSMMTKQKGPTLYLFDEPSIGLHHVDIQRLIAVFESLIEEGNTILFIEHNSLLIQSADQLITLGPGSGENGGNLVL